MTARAIEDRAVSIGSAVTPLLALAVLIQYIDRGNIATAAPLVKSELGLTATQVGLLISAFYWTYTPGNLLSGWLSHRLNAYRTLALGLAIWSAATIATSLAASFAVLLGLRLVLGLGESAFFPCSSRLLAQHMPTSKMGAANGLIAVGLALGPAVGTWAGGNLMAAAGWRASFLVFGVASLLWLIPWRAATRDLERAETSRPPQDGPGYADILKRRELWGASMGHFCANYAFYFVISWLPLWLVQARGLSLTEMAGVGGAIYGVYAASSYVSGRLADRWIASGASVNRARKACIVGSHLVTAASLVAAALGGGDVALVALFVTAVSFGVGTSPIYAIGQTLAGPKAGGRWVGLQNGFGNIAGIVGPVATGLLVDVSHGYGLAFAAAGAFSLAGAFCWGLVIPKVAPLDWESRAA